MFFSYTHYYLRFIIGIKLTFLVHCGRKLHGAVLQSRGYCTYDYLTKCAKLFQFFRLSVYVIAIRNTHDIFYGTRAKICLLSDSQVLFIRLYRLIRVRCVFCVSTNQKMNGFLIGIGKLKNCNNSGWTTYRPAVFR